MDESEAMLTSRFMDMDENYFTPTIVAHSQESVSQHVLACIIYPHSFSLVMKGLTSTGLLIALT